MGRPANKEVSREVAAIVREFAERYGPLYVQRILLPSLFQHVNPITRSEEAARGLLCDPAQCLRSIFAVYAFSRRGRERDELAEAALEALDRIWSQSDLLAMPNGEQLWRAFEQVCLERRRKPMEPLNRGVLQGLAELAQEAREHGGSGSIALWIVDAAIKSGRIEDQFMRMVEVRGVGPKVASLFLRDVVYLFNLEARIEPMDRLYYQPIDKWIRGLSEYIVDDYDDPADWILAGKVSKIARKSGVSGTLLNMGTTYFGSREAHSTEQFAAQVSRFMRTAIVPGA